MAAGQAHPFIVAGGGIGGLATALGLAQKDMRVLVLEKALIADSGGAGRRRGGLGVRTKLRKLHDDGRPTLFSVYPEGVRVAPAGLDYEATVEATLDALAAHLARHVDLDRLLALAR